MPSLVGSEMCIRDSNSIVTNIMNHLVELYVAGRVFKEQVYARNYAEAKQVALARNPNARVVSVTAVL